MVSEQGTVIEQIPCHFHDCSSSDGMTVYQKSDKVDGYCYVCSRYSPDPYQNGQTKKATTVTSTPHRLSVLDVSKFPSAALEDRCLRQDTLDYFGVKVGFSLTDRSISNHYYPIIKSGAVSGYKDRVVETKDFFSVGDCKKGELFGQFQANISRGRKLFITEGELDAMSVFQTLRDKQIGTQWAHLIPSVVSITKGAGGADKELARHMDFLNMFEQIVLVFDNDEAGNEGLEKVVKVLPIEKTYIVKLPKKDANDMLVAGLSGALERALIFSAKPYRPITVVGVEDIIEEALEEPTMGMKWLWPSLNKVTYGRHPGNLYGVGGGVGIGKSTFWFAQMGYDMQEGLGKHGMFMFEETPADAINLLAGQIYAKKFNDPTVNISQDERREMLMKLNDHVYMCDHRNMLLGSRDSWEEIVQAIRHMAIVEGCTHITLDPMTALTAQMSSSEANEFLNGALAQMAGLAKQLHICIYYGSHLNKPDRSKPHEEGGRVLLSQFTGSRAMIRWSQYILGIERDSQDTDEVMANTSWCRLLKIRRRFSKEQCLFPIFYKHEDGSFKEVSKVAGGDVPPSERTTKENARSGLNSDQTNRSF